MTKSRKTFVTVVYNVHSEILYKIDIENEVVLIRHLNIFTCNLSHDSLGYVVKLLASDSWAMAHNHNATAFHRKPRNLFTYYIIKLH